MDIEFLLAGIHTLTPERKQELKDKFLNDTLSDHDKAELQEHIIDAMVTAQVQSEQAEAFLKQAS